MKTSPLLLAASTLAVATAVDECPGYKVVGQYHGPTSFSAQLALNGKPCNAYGTDIENLTLEVSYETADRLHVLIRDAANDVYQVPGAVFPRPDKDECITSQDSHLAFNFTDDPFSFSVSRKATGETLFNTSSAQLIFESQYLRLRTSLPETPHLYGLGEHTDPFMLRTSNYTRTFWNRDAFGTPEQSNLYGHHDIYFEQRPSGTHGVFLLNSNGKDIKINNDDGQYLEYNTLGGVLDFYFFNGPKPKDVSMQYAQLAKMPALQPYWGLGFHQCRYGYRDAYAVAEVIANYSKAGIPLETMWTDIDYMEKRRVFSLDPDRFPLERMREIVDYLHAHQQHYVVMVDPAVWAGNLSDGTSAEPYHRALEADALLKNGDGSPYHGVVWPGVTSFPDWFAPSTQNWWNSEFERFFDPDTGVDIDALWIDMNEPSNFCDFPCSDPAGFAESSGNPPAAPPVRPTAPRPIPGFPADFQPQQALRLAKREAVPSLAPVRQSVLRRQSNDRSQTKPGQALGLPDRDLLFPKYHINNTFDVLSNRTANTDLIHQNGLAMYDTHDMYGSMMSTASRVAMQARRVDRRPLIITRSTFAGAGKDVGHWLGDNLSTWFHYRISIAEMMAFAALFQIPMVGADVCGFESNTTETLCARWALLGAFYPFFRNHNGYESLSQEFYVWNLTTEAAKHAMDYRFRLLDYLYTAMWKQNQTGTPTISPLFFEYPEDANTYPIDLQFFFGESLLVSPVTEENSTSVDFYLPDDIFYDFFTHEPVRGRAASAHRDNVKFTEIPVHIKGGSILPLRCQSANSTTELRKQDFSIVVAPGLDGKASGELYLDDGDSLIQDGTTEIKFNYDNGKLTWNGKFDYDPKVVVESIVILGVSAPRAAQAQMIYDDRVKTRTLQTRAKLTEAFEMDFDN